MTDKPVPLLTAEQAKTLSHYWNAKHPMYAALDAIATGRTRVIEPINEKAAKGAYRKWVGAADTLYGERAWLAALRHIGAIADEGER